MGDGCVGWDLDLKRKLAIAREDNHATRMMMPMVVNESFWFCGGVVNVIGVVVLITIINGVMSGVGTCVTGVGSGVGVIGVTGVGGVGVGVNTGVGVGVGIVVGVEVGVTGVDVVVGVGDGCNDAVAVGASVGVLNGGGEAGTEWYPLCRFVSADKTTTTKRTKVTMAKAMTWIVIRSPLVLSLSFSFSFFIFSSSLILGSCCVTGITLGIFRFVSIYLLQTLSR